MICVFFDIDGTLLLSGGAGRVAMQQVMQEMFGVASLATLDVHGRTDRAIIRDLFAAHEIEWTEVVYRDFTSRYHRQLACCISACRGKLLAGVPRLLESLAEEPDVSMGLLTGNSLEAASIKVRHFGVEHFFRFGGYGGGDECRNAVARLALEDCRRWALPREIDEGRLWVVGDTVHDVRCARAIGARCIGVATGGNSLEELIAAGADLAVGDFGDCQVLVEAMMAG